MFCPLDAHCDGALVPGGAARQPVHVVVVVDLTRATAAYARLDLMRTVLK